MAQQTFSGVPGDFTAGQVLTAADMDKLREFLLYLIKDGDETDTGEVSPLILDLGSDTVTIGGNPVQAGAWSTWTPTITNWTAGNAVIVAKYAQFGKTVHFFFGMTMGSTTAYSGAPIFTAPTTKLASDFGNHFVTNYEKGGAIYTGAARFYVGGTDNRIYPYYFTSTADQWGGLSPTVPFTWTTGDIYICKGTYEAA